MSDLGWFMLLFFEHIGYFSDGFENLGLCSITAAEYCWAAYHFLDGL
jgi:hypothetical protein